MTDTPSTLSIVPVLSSADVKRDLEWYEQHTGFQYYFGDHGYAGMKRDHLEFHLQFHHGTEDDPVLSGVMKIFVKDIMPFYNEFLNRGTITKEKLRLNTTWGTHEFGFYDLNNNAVFIVQDT